MSLPLPVEAAAVPSRWKTRGWNALWTCSASAPLLLARWLKPDGSGMGTHRQLGLPPCTFLWATGFPCPFCGMTTSWTWAAHLEIARSIHTQPVGFAFFVATAAFVPVLLGLTVSGHHAFHPEDVLSRIRPRAWMAIFAVVVAGWMWKIALVRGWIA